MEEIMKLKRKYEKTIKNNKTFLMFEHTDRYYCETCKDFCYFDPRECISLEGGGYKVIRYCRNCESIGEDDQTKEFICPSCQKSSKYSDLNKGEEYLCSCGYGYKTSDNYGFRITSKEEVFLTERNILHIRRYKTQVRLVDNCYPKVPKLVFQNYVKKYAFNLDTGISYELPAVMNGKGYKTRYGHIYIDFKRSNVPIHLRACRDSLFWSSEEDISAKAFKHALSIMQKSEEKYTYKLSDLLAFVDHFSDKKSFQKTMNLPILVHWNKYKSVNSKEQIEEILNVQETIALFYRNMEIYPRHQNTIKPFLNFYRNISSRLMKGDCLNYFENAIKNASMPRSLAKKFYTDKKYYILPYFRLMKKILGVEDVNHIREFLPVFEYLTEAGQYESMTVHTYSIGSIISLLEIIKMHQGTKKMLSLVKSLIRLFKREIYCRHEVLDTGNMLSNLLALKEKLYSFDEHYAESFSEDEMLEFAKDIEVNLFDITSKKGLKEIHDSASYYLTKINCLVNEKDALVPFPHNETHSVLCDSISGYEFKLPENQLELTSLGTSFSNCVAGYADRIRGNRSIVVYAKKGEEFKLCIELRMFEGKYCLEQLKIKKNNIPEGEDAKVALEWIEKHAINTEGSFDYRRAVANIETENYWANLMENEYPETPEVLSENDDVLELFTA